MSAPWSFVAVVSSVSLACAASAAAQEGLSEHPSVLDRAHTVAEIEAGIIALPNAPISAANRGGTTPIGAVGNGDATVQTGFHLLYRATREWAFGAGVSFTPTPTSDKNYGSTAGLTRSHARSYFLLGGEARYFPVRSRSFEAWFGITGGVVVIADRFTTNAPTVPSFLGTTTVTVSTEGVAIGVQAGANYLVTDQWVLGLALRADQWILPSEPDQAFLPFATEASCDSIGDCRTLTGSVRAFELGVTVGYRIPL
jgi:opacity protein-like surface antigen